MAHSTKTLYDPIHGVIDIGHLLPIIDNPHFQALRGKRQLGVTSLVFPYAVHSRFEHSIGAYRATRTLGHVWMERGWITKEQFDGMCAYALLHDSGHPALSHVTEDFCRLDDDEKSLELIETVFRAALIACGIDPDLVAQIARSSVTRDNNPLYLAVHDRNIGMEKLDYLERDGVSTGIGYPPGIHFLRKYIMLVDGQIAVDEKMVGHVIDVMDFYMKMYQEVYLRKGLVITQRMVHKGIHHLVRSGELDPEDLYALTDAELLGGYFFRSQEPVAREMYARVRNRQLYQEAVVLRSKQTMCETRIADKDISVGGLDPDVMRDLTQAPQLQKRNHEGLEILEAEVERAVGLPAGVVLLTPVFNPERFEAKDVMLSCSGRVESLKERRPAHFAKMEETARSHTAIRVCAQPEYRAALCRAADGVKEVLLSVL